MQPTQGLTDGRLEACCGGPQSLVNRHMDPALVVHLIDHSPNSVPARSDFALWAVQFLDSFHHAQGGTRICRFDARDRHSTAHQHHSTELKRACQAHTAVAASVPGTEIQRQS